MWKVDITSEFCWTTFRRNSTRKIVRWFEELINLNHLTIFITEFHQKLVEKLSKKNSTISLALIAAWSVFHLTLRSCETPPSPPAPDPVGIENCKQLFSPLLAFTTQKIATNSTDIISAVCVAFFGSSMQAVMKKSCLQFLIPTAVFKNIWSTFSVRLSRAAESTTEAISLALHSVLHALNTNASASDTISTRNV